MKTFFKFAQDDPASFLYALDFTVSWKFNNIK